MSGFDDTKLASSRCEIASTAKVEDNDCPACSSHVERLLRPMNQCACQRSLKHPEQLRLLLELHLSNVCHHRSECPTNSEKWESIRHDFSVVASRLGVRWGLAHRQPCHASSRGLLPPQRRSSLSFTTALALSSFPPFLCCASSSCPCLPCPCRHGRTSGGAEKQDEALPDG